MIDTRDILYKAAEDVQQGMWCAGARFANERLDDDQSYSARGFVEHEAARYGPVDQLFDKYRCAEGSIVLSARLLGGDWDDAMKAIDAVEARMADRGNPHTLWGYNDIVLSLNDQSDPFTAGQVLGELFRTTADSL